MAQRLTTPLLPDDYLTLINPLLAQTSLRARISKTEMHGAHSRTLHLQTARVVPTFQAGQHVQIGVDLKAVRHRRSFSLTGVATGAPTRAFQITVKANGEGGVSDHLVHRANAGDVVFLEPPTGEFTLDPGSNLPILMLAGGSGITPFLSMLRTMRSLADPPPVHLIYCARTNDDMIASNELCDYARGGSWFTLTLWNTSTQGHFNAVALERNIPQWRDHEAYVCGPAGMLTAADSQWRTAGLLDRLHIEQFQTQLAVVYGQGGQVTFRQSSRAVEAEANDSLMRVGEAAGVFMPSGCRIGICHTCVVPLKSGRVRDLRTGEVHGEVGELIQTCINAAACDVELDI